MRSMAVATVLLGLGACFSSAWAYSPIWTVDGWDADRLEEAGITVESWEHPQMGEDPPLNWVRITYDASKLQADQSVLMTLWVTTSDGQTICTCRAERTPGSASKLTLLFAVRQENIGHGRVDIVAPDLLAAAAGRNFGNPGFAGYTLRLKRILELARLEPAGQAQGNAAQVTPIQMRSGQMIEPPFCCPPLVLRDAGGVVVQKFDVTAGAQRLVAPAGVYSLIGHDPAGVEILMQTIEVTDD